jgi:hypothetical protein
MITGGLIVVVIIVGAVIEQSLGNIQRKAEEMCKSLDLMRDDLKQMNLGLTPISSLHGMEVDLKKMTRLVDGQLSSLTSTLEGIERNTSNLDR